jgi:hypothetical protein
MTQKTGASSQASASDTPNLDRVQAEFEAEIRAKGMDHVFQWMHGWFDKVGRAIVEDELLRVLGDKARDKQARNLAAMDLLMPLASGISSHSSSASANLLRQSKLSALADIVDYDFGQANGYGSRMHRLAAWDEWRAKHIAPTNP